MPEGLSASLPEASADARALITLLEERIAELQNRVSVLDAELKEGRAELKQAHDTISDLTAKAARAEALDLLLAAQREMTDSIRAECDRWADQARQVQQLLADRRTRPGLLARLFRKAG